MRFGKTPWVPMYMPLVFVSAEYYIMLQIVLHIISMGGMVMIFVTLEVSLPKIYHVEK